MCFNYLMYKRRGFTLIELLIVIAIIAILVIMVIFGLNANLGKSRDGKRKADLDRIKIAMEDYYGDKNQYPNLAKLSCDSDLLSPYLAHIPCDPKTKLPYCYIYDADAPIGQNFRVLATFENTTDPIIQTLGCSDPSEYCGYETECITQVGSRGHNYGVASTNVAVASENIGSGSIGATPTPTPTPSLGPLPSTIPGALACDPSRNCNNYGTNANAIAAGCAITWPSDSNCNNYCDSVPSYGLCAR